MFLYVLVSYFIYYQLLTVCLENSPHTCLSAGLVPLVTIKTCTFAPEI